MLKALCFIMILSAASVQAQQHSDSTFLKAALENNIKRYGQVIGGQTLLNNGSQYRQPDQSNDEQHPFFEFDDWVYGKVTYDNQKYDNVPLLFDIYKEQVITENYYNASEMALVYEKLSAFNIGEHNFIKIDDETLPKPGFYELIYNGPSRVIAKKQKVMRETLSTREILIAFDNRFRYFIYKNGAYFQVRNRSSALKLFEDKKSSMKEHVKKYKMLFKTDFEKALKLTAAHYDALNKLP